MSRSRKVEHEAAVNAAMEFFWTHGFNASGTRRIEEKTGITRFTLQTTYGGKMKLFLTALDAYLDTFENSELMRSFDGGVEGIARFFEIRGNPEAMPDIACQGCFMLNSMVEFSTGNPEINQRADRYFGMLRYGFRSALMRSDESDGLRPDLNIPETVEILLSAALGLNCVIRAGSDLQAGKAMAASIAAMVRSWAAENPGQQCGTHS